MERQLFNKKRLKLKSLEQRVHDLDISIIKPLKRVALYEEIFKKVALRIVEAKKLKRQVIMMIGGHVIRAGVQKYIIDLIEKGYISCVAMNGACIIHDYELALVGKTTESVAKYIKTGEFGLWIETGYINDIINRAYAEKDNGMGNVMGKAIELGDYPYKNISILAACYRIGIPATVHIGIGYDIIHEHPNFDGAAAGALSYNDFLHFAECVENLNNGVIMNFGSAVMAPEVFLKALSMARNIAYQENRAIDNFTSLVCDLYPLHGAHGSELCRDDPAYYFRPLKTMLVRSIQGDNGESFYVRGNHKDTIPSLWSALI